jgi:general secretion pathway protein K
MMPLRQRGAALLMAMLTVALVATFSAAALWQQWRSIEVESAERARVQSGWILTGALDWARLLLREDHIGQGQATADHLGEPWAVPLQEARLSSFLAADRNVSTDTGAEVMDAFLSGQIIDLQSLVNVNNLVDARGVPSQEDKETMARLFDLLGLPMSELDRLAENMRFAADPSGDNRSSPQAPLRPQKLEQLVWLGLSPQTVAVLQPYVTLLPRRTLVNLNTAPAETIYAAAHNLDLADAQRLVQERERAHFRSIEDAQKLLPGGAAKMPRGQANVDTQTEFFEVRARLRLDQLIVEEQSVVERPLGSVDVFVVRRERGAVDPTSLAQAPAKR